MTASSARRRQYRFIHYDSEALRLLHDNVLDMFASQTLFERRIVASNRASCARS
jgi:hypothetical protein